MTCEKLRWTISSGERYLKPEYRTSGIMNMHKTSRVEFTPVGVVGAIVPFNYPFHNVFNPLIAALFAGNAIVIKVCEFAVFCFFLHSSHPSISFGSSIAHILGLASNHRTTCSVPDQMLCVVHGRPYAVC